MPEEETSEEVLNEETQPNSRKVLLVDNYKTNDTKHVQKLQDTIKEAGFDVEIKRHSDLKQELKQTEGEVDLAAGYHAYVSSGSGKTWQKSGKKDRKGKEYLDMADPVHNNLAKSQTPGYHICAGADYLITALRQEHGSNKDHKYQMQHMGSFKRGNDNGKAYNGTYGLKRSDIPDEHIDNVVSDVETFNHNNETYVASLNYGNKRAVKYHAERTEQGKKELKGWLNDNAMQEMADPGLRAIKGGKKDKRYDLPNDNYLANAA